ncbi:GH12048 [Drosophila grimshawi]|uniref:GH12048 n=1 Tax=Drosophila grimshawi TaxID=7222 RepID=B4JKH8_DROGR|nr:GH12048 [Drosophila grimshawi]
MEDYWGLSSTTDINCTQPAIDDFPRDLFTEAQRQSGAVVLHVIASLYLFVALAVVCDEYFVPAVEKICAALNMSNDVAGATFMAAATSAPELFVNVIGTFITEGDIGVGTIVGSAVFNILAVAACCGIGAGMTIPLDWWPLTRDSIAYGVTVAILICVMHDERVEWYEALILVSLYAVYLAVMYFDKSFQKCAKGGVKQARSRSRSSNCSIHTKNSNEKEPELVENRICQNMASIQLNGGLNNDQAKASNTTTTTTTTSITTTTTTTGVGGGGGGGGGTGVGGANVAAVGAPAVGAIASVAIVDNADAEAQLSVAVAAAAATAAAEEVDQEGYSLLTYPKGTSCFAQFTWIIIWPIHLLFRIAIPDCKKAKNNKIFPLTFIMCIVWIGSLSYVVAWMITIIGDTLKIPDSVMGITFLAAGTSVPEAVSSVIVAKRVNNETSFLVSTLRYLDEQLLYDILPRATCPGEVPDAPLDEFPEIFTVEQLRQGWVVLHVFAAIYLFILLAIICNDYFLPTVECICEDLHLSKDVAAATFMATATSMPEFFTNTISTLILESDMGLGTIIGSLMFNTLGRSKRCGNLKSLRALRNCKKLKKRSQKCALN